MNWRETITGLRATTSALSVRLPGFGTLDPHMQETVRGSAVAFALLVFGRGIGFGFNVVLASLLGAEGAGNCHLRERISR